MAGRRIPAMPELMCPANPESSGHTDPVEQELESRMLGGVRGLLVGPERRPRLVPGQRRGAVVDRRPDRRNDGLELDPVQPRDGRCLDLIALRGPVVRIAYVNDTDFVGDAKPIALQGHCASIAERAHLCLAYLFFLTVG